MKKSTLITTIAMIVVVVVALSTATYAWFSSSTNTYATQTIQTTGEAGLTVLTNTTAQYLTSTNATFTGTALFLTTQGTAPAVAGIRAGLWAPTAELSNRPSSNSSTEANSSAINSFIAGTQSLDGATFKVTDVPTVTTADMIRVTSTKGGTNEVLLTIFIGAADTDAARYAAQGVSFYLAGAVNTGTEQSPVYKIANTDYNYFDTNHANYALTKDSDNHGEGIEVNDTTAIDKSFTPVSASGEIKYNEAWETANESSPIPGINHRSTDVTVGTYFENAMQGDDADLAGIAYNTYTKWYSMTVSLGNFSQNQSLNLLLYNWLDGAYLNDAAKSANIAISYKFSYAS